MISTAISQQLQLVVDALVSDYQAQKVILYGSGAQGAMKEFSDIDLIVIKDTDARFYDRIGEALKAVWDISPKPPLDIIVYTPKEFAELGKNSTFVREEVLAKGRVVYG